MGKGKGSFDFWAARVAVSQIVFEVSGEMHEQVARDAMRLAGNKMPGKSLQSPLKLTEYLYLGPSNFQASWADKERYHQGCGNSPKEVTPPLWV